uniref:Uncharacterized protein n=1 Tax=Meloidogyne incognita TaxID=6306 RepID=A0A914MDI7_MELIC
MPGHSIRGNTHCHVLIAIESACNALLQFNRWTPFLLAVTGNNFISLYKCCWLQILPLFVSLIGAGLIFIIGVERLICIAFPLWFVSFFELYCKK